MSGERTDIKYLNQEQTTRLLAVITDPRDRALFTTIYHYGLRVSEATLLCLEDVNLARRRIHIHRLKGGHGGERPLFRNTTGALKAYLDVRLPTGPALFTGRQGNLNRRRIEQLFKRYAREAGLPPSFTVRCLRHSIATHLLEAGMGIEFVQDHLGHVNIQNTLIYARLTDRRREEVYRQLEESPEIVKV
jgi:site-specific recombinase XerD